MTEHKPIIGWCEWIALPELGIHCVKAKIDTGARTSCLHAFSLEEFSQNGIELVRFRLHPLQHRTDVEVICVAPVVDRRLVSDSGGHREERIVIRTPVVLGSQRWDTEFTLTNRDTMLFRSLLGRSAINHRYWVDSALSFQQSSQYPIGVEAYFS